MNLIAGAGEREARAPAESRFDGRSMGSPLRLTLTGVPAGEAEAAWRTVVEEFDAVDRTMSAYRADSAITELNERVGQDESVGVDRRLYEAIRLADRAWRLTDGRFDILVLDALQELGRPGLHRLTATGRATMRGTGSGIRRDPRPRRVALSAPADLGGIGKGLALRWAWRRLATTVDHPDRGALLEAGGDVVVGGQAPDGGQWSIGMEAPDGRSDPIAVVGLGAGSLCTSSTRLATWVNGSGERVHHLVDPRTGWPGGDGLAAVTVSTEDPAWAEIWSKALFLAGPDAIGDLARSRGLAAWWVSEAGDLQMTPAARQTTRWP